MTSGPPAPVPPHDALLIFADGFGTLETPGLYRLAIADDVATPSLILEETGDPDTGIGMWFSSAAAQHYTAGSKLYFTDRDLTASMPFPIMLRRVNIDGTGLETLDANLVATLPDSQVQVGPLALAADSLTGDVYLIARCESDQTFSKLWHRDGGTGDWTLLRTFSQFDYHFRDMQVDESGGKLLISRRPGGGSEEGVYVFDLADVSTVEEAAIVVSDGAAPPFCATPSHMLIEQHVGSPSPFWELREWRRSDYLPAAAPLAVADDGFGGIARVGSTWYAREYDDDSGMYGLVRVTVGGSPGITQAGVLEWPWGLIGPNPTSAMP